MNKICLEKAVPIPATARSNASICGRSFAGIAVSNHSGHMTVFLLWVLCVFEADISATGQSLVQKIPTECDVHERDGGNLQRMPKSTRGRTAMRKIKLNGI